MTNEYIENLEYLLARIRSQARALAAGTGLGAQALQRRQHEGGGLAAAGVRGHEQVGARQRSRNGLELDSGGFGVTGGSDGFKQGGLEPEFGKIHQEQPFAHPGRCGRGELTVRTRWTSKHRRQPKTAMPA